MIVISGKYRVRMRPVYQSKIKSERALREFCQGKINRLSLKPKYKNYARSFQKALDARDYRFINRQWGLFTHIENL